MCGDGANDCGVSRKSTKDIYIYIEMFNGHLFIYFIYTHLTCFDANPSPPGAEEGPQRHLSVGVGGLRGVPLHLQDPQHLLRAQPHQVAHGGPLGSCHTAREVRAMEPVGLHRCLWAAGNNRWRLLKE